MNPALFHLLDRIILICIFMELVSKRFSEGLTKIKIQFSTVVNTLEIHSYISFLFLFPHLPTSIHWKLCPKQIYLCTNFCSKLLNKFPLQRNLFHSQIHMVEVPLQGTYLRYYISLVLKYTEGTCGILCCLMKLHVAFGVKI